MRLSFEQARKLNIDEDIIRRAEELFVGGEMARAVREDLAIEPPKPKRATRIDGFASKLDRDFAETLKLAQRGGWVERWWYEPLGLRLAPKCYYHPDFLVETTLQMSVICDPRPILIECKGGWFRDDAKVKVKVAAELFPCFRWLVVFREKRSDWDVREVDARGIGRNPIAIPWIGG